MSKIDRLIRDLCPDGVPHVALSDVARYSDTRVDASELSSVNFVGVDNLLPDKAGRVDASYLPNTVRLTEFMDGDVLIGNIRPYLKKVWLADRRGGCSGDVLAIRLNRDFRDRMLPRFLYYLLSSDRFFAYNMRHARGAKMPRGSKPAILLFRVAVPPLQVQEEVVRILDKFTELEAELGAELEARQKQYAHYRAGLMEHRDASVISVGDIVINISSGRNKSRVENGRFPVYGSTGQIGTTDEASYSGDALLVARVGANAGRVNAASGEYDVSDNTLIVWPTEAWDVRFAFHQLTQMNLNQYAVGGGQPLVTGKLLKNLRIRLPSVAEQRRVAAVLDTFDALVNDISSGLPAEIAARRKQYEYYRDKLLTFEELGA